MHPAANILIAESHWEDLSRAAAAGALRAKARRVALDGLNMAAPAGISTATPAIEFPDAEETPLMEPAIA